MSRKRKKAYVLFALLLSIAMAATDTIGVKASSTGEYLKTLNEGVAAIIDPKSENDTGDKKAEAVEKLDTLASESETEETADADDIFMANVQTAMNVRKEPSDSAEKAGILYKDCGGHVLDQENGWTKIESGDLVGWAKNEYILVGEKAKAAADEVGRKVIVCQTDALNVRNKAASNADSEAVLAKGDSLEIVSSDEKISDGWIAVDFEGENGYVQEKYVTQDFKVDAGETQAKIEVREKAAAEKKAEEEKAAKEKAEKEKSASKNSQKNNTTSGAQTTTTGTAVVANADEVRLLGALIQCEAGCVSYDGQLAVGAVVMNRVKSGAYPSTIQDVIYASGQFTPAGNGKVARYYNGDVNAQCIQAAQAAIAGQSNVGGATHFRRAGNHDGMVIANQVFW